MNNGGNYKRNITALILLATLTIFLCYSVYGALCGGTTCAPGTSVSIVNSKPNITDVTPPGAVTLIPNNVKAITIKFNVTDPNGAGDINKSTANATVFKVGETSRYNYTCTNISETADTVEFECGIDMQFYDGDGEWTINVSIQDNSEVWETNETVTFTVNTLDNVDMDDPTLEWNNLVPNTEDNEGEHITFTNKGNQDYASINVTGQNATSGSDNLNSTNFAVDIDTGQVSGQTYLLDNATLEWVGASLSHGATETELMYSYLDVPALQPFGDYTSIANWDVLFIS